MEVPQDEFMLPFFDENVFVRKFCKICGNHYWTQDPDAENCGDSPCVFYTFIGDPPTNRRFTVSEMREKFLSFFEEHDHKRINPYPVVARWRDDLMVTIASIIDFQPYVTEGILPPPANPLVISQPCIRFEDIDLVGHTAGRHFTIFEMGGHHAFNYRDKPQIYWKDETVRFHHELITEDLGVPSEMVTYKEGLWSGGGNAGFDLEGCVAGLEISTLVFMMFRVFGTRFEPMPIQVVDTGYGIERWSWLSLGTPSAFHSVYGTVLEKAFSWSGLTDIDEEILAKSAKYSTLSRPEEKMKERKRLAKIIGMTSIELDKLLSPVETIYAALDHTKSIAFILSEGVVPSNVQEGYLARLLFRRSFRLLRKNNIQDKLPDLIEAQIEFWGRDFPQLHEMREEIMEMVSVEEKKYRETLRRGSGLVKRYLKRTKGTIPVNQLIEFYDSHGLTPEDVVDAVDGTVVNVSVPENFYAMVAGRHITGETRKRDEVKVELAEKVEGLKKTRTLFYEKPYMREFEAEILSVIDDNYIVLNKTAFYAEGGGQISDLGRLMKGSDSSAVVNVKSVDGIMLHEIEGETDLKEGDTVKGVLDWERRLALMRSHTATHILLGSARRILGDHAWQAGAQKGVVNSRLDISHFQRLTRREVESIERLTNQVVAEGRTVVSRWMPRNEAEAKYGFRLYQGGAVPGKEIRVVEIDDWDVEACGGTHLLSTSEAGLIKILNTERVQDGVERLVFATGPQALAEVQRRELALIEVAELLGSPMEKIREAASNAVETLKELRHKLDSLRQTASRLTADNLLKKALRAKNVNIIVESLSEDSAFLIEVGNALTQQEESQVVVVMHSEVEPRLVVMASRAAIASGFNAGELASEVANIIGGGGGGEPHFGQGGGGDLKKFKEEGNQIIKAVKQQLG